VSTVVTTLQKGLPGFSPLRTQQLPGGSLILDQNLDLIKKHFDAYAPIVSQIARTLNINLGPGGTSSSGTLPFGPLSGDVSTPSAGSTVTTIGAHVVSYGKMQQANAVTLLGNPTGALADIQEITLGTNLSFAGNVLNATGGGSVSLPAQQVGYGTGASITSAPYLQWNGVNPGLSSLQELQIYNDVSSPLGVTGIRIGIDAAFAQNFSFSMIAPGWSSGGGLSPGDVLAEQNSGASAALHFSNFGSSGTIDFSTGNARTQRLLIDSTGSKFTSGNVSVTNLLSIGQSTFDSTTHTVLADDAAPASLAAWDTRHAVFGRSGATGGGLGVSYGNGANTVYLNAAIPNTSFSNLRADATTFALYSNGTTQGFKQDASGNVYDSVLGNGLLKTTGGTGLHAIATPGTDYLVQAYSTIQANASALTQRSILNFGAALTAVDDGANSRTNVNVIIPSAAQVAFSNGTSLAGATAFTYNSSTDVLAGGNAIGINGVTVPNNVSLCVGHTTNANRDRVQFFLGGGVLGGGGTSDSTLFDVNPTSTVITAGVTAGIYATQRIRSAGYTAGGVTVTETASLYIDGPPTTGGGIGGGPNLSVHVASGTTKIANLQATSLVAGGVTAVDTTGLFGIAGVGGLPPAISAETPYFINVTGSTLITGASVWLATSQGSGASASAIEYPHPFAAAYAALEIRLITNAITSGSMTIFITRNGAGAGTPITLTNVSSGTLATGTVVIGSPAVGDRWGVAVGGTGTGMSGNMVFTATLMLSPNVF
jgi:hypothetical protein